MQNVLKYIVYTCLMLVPFLAYYVADGGSFDLLNWGTSGMFFPFISGKNLIFRVLVEVALAGWILLALLDPKYRPKKSPILFAYAAFIIAIFIADVFGVNPFRSFWSNFERMEGFVGHIHLFAYFVVLSSMLTTLTEWRNMFKVSLVSNALVMSFGFAQLLGAKEYFFASFFPKASAWFGQNFPIHMSGTRLDSTIGNSAYYAIYCLFFAFISALLWTQTKSATAKKVYLILGILNLISLFYSGTRGTIVGLVAGLFISLGIVAIKEKGKTRNAVIGSLVSILVALVCIFSFKNTSFIQNSPTLSRVASIAPGDLTTMSRITIWTISYEAWKERPIFGYGQENFSGIFAERFIPSKMYNLEPWYDRSHDVFFDWLIAGGIVGLLTYLSLFVAALWLMWRKGLEGDEHFPLREKALLTGLLAGYFIHNIFVFDNLISYILFIAILGYIVAKTYKGHTYAPNAKVSEETVTWLWAPIVAVLFVVVFYMISYKAFLANKELIRGMDVNRHLQNQKSFAQILAIQKEAFRAAIDLRVVGSEEAREQFLQAVARMVQVKVPPELPQPEKQAIAQNLNDLVTEARKEVENSYPQYQNDVRALSIFGMFYNSIGDFPSSQKVLEQALTISPYKQVTAFDLIRSYLSQQKYSEAEALAKKVFLAAPEFATALKYYVITAIYAGKLSEVIPTLTSVGKTFPIDADTINSLVDVKQYDAAIAILLQLKQKSPELGTQVDEYIKSIVAKKAGR